MLSQFIYFSRLIIVLRLILDKYAYSAPGSWNIFLFATLGGRLLEVGDYSRGATIRGGLLFE